MAVLVEMLAAAIERAGSTEAGAVAHALDGARFDGRMAGMAGLTLHPATMRAADHQLLQPLVVSVMERAGMLGVPHAVEGTGYGFRTVRSYDAAALALTPRCRMTRPE
jgi:branched-chain amino acid transport system substrate-binding protein